MALPDAATADGYDVQLQTNHLSHFLLARLAFPLLQRAADLRGEARIVQHSSGARKFPGGELISNTAGNPTNFIANPVGTSPYGIEYNGLTQVFTVTGLLDPTLSTHTIVIAVADTGDSIFDSGVFIGGLTTSTVTDGGGIGTTDVPEPATLSVLGLGLLGLGIARRRRQRAR